MTKGLPNFRSDVVTYDNTPENAALIGWDKDYAAEYLRDENGDWLDAPNAAPKVTHDHYRGLFFFHA